MYIIANAVSIRNMNFRDYYGDDDDDGSIGEVIFDTDGDNDDNDDDNEPVAFSTDTTQNNQNQNQNQNKPHPKTPTRNLKQPIYSEKSGCCTT